MADRKLKAGEKKQAEAIQHRFGHDREPHILTDKEKTKVLPCRDPKCRRPCVVNTFAAPAKVACLDHRDRKAKPDAVHALDESLEPHVLTDKEKTKTVACGVCGRPCVVTTFAAPAKVRCKEHGGAKFRPRRDTSLVKGEDGRHREVQTVSFVDPKDLEWSDFICAMPFLDREYTEAEWIEAEEERTLQIEATQLRDQAKKDRDAADAEFTKAPAKSEREKKAQAAITEADGRVTEMEAAIKRHRARRDELSRIAWVRAAINANWTLRDRTLHGVVDGITREVTLPQDYLDAEGIKEATK